MDLLSNTLKKRDVKINPLNYEMKEGNYFIKMRILEASDIKPLEGQGYVNPYIIVRIQDQELATKVVKKQLSPVFDKNMFFEFSEMTKGSLETMKISIELMDYTLLLEDEVIGATEIDLTSVYYKPYHQFHMAWFSLVDPLNRHDDVVGYVLMNIEVLGPGDEPYVHETLTAEDTNETVHSDKVKVYGHLIIAECFKAEHVVSMNVGSKFNNLVVVINYGGISVRSSISENSNEGPSWNEVLYLAASLPNHSKNIQIELYHQTATFQDVFIGTGLIPINLFKSLDDLPSTWINVYGPPLSASGEKSDKMARFGARKGSCYRGRILMRFSSRYHNNPVSYAKKMFHKVPELLIPTPPSKIYHLRIGIYTGQELPGDSGMLHFVLGPYLLKTELKKSQNGMIEWYQTIESERIRLPMDITMCPDLVVYFCDKDYESHRKCFYRISPVSFMKRSKKRFELEKPRTFIAKLKEDQALDLVEDDQFSGFVTIRPLLFSFKPDPATDLLALKQHEKEYKIKLFIFLARDLPPANDSGVSNTFLVIRVCGKTFVTKTQNYSLNPEWYEIKEAIISVGDVKDNRSADPTLVIMAYHSELGEDFTVEDIEKNSKKKTLLGRYWLDLDVSRLKRFKKERGSIEIIYKEPKWVPLVYDKDQEAQGKLLMSYALIPKEDIEEVEKELISKKFFSIVPESKQIDISLFSIGIRNMVSHISDSFFKPLWCSVEMKVSGFFDQLESDPAKIGKQMDGDPLPIRRMEDYPSSEIGKVLATPKIKVENHAITFNRTFRFRVRVPFNPAVCPVLEVYLFHYPLGQKKLLGTTSYPLKEAFGFFYGNEDDLDYQTRWKNFFSATVANRMEEKKTKAPRMKVIKIRPENKLLYMDEMVYEMPKKGYVSKNTQKREIWKMQNRGKAIENKIEKIRRKTIRDYRLDKYNHTDDQIEFITNEDLEELEDAEREVLFQKYPYLSHLGENQGLSRKKIKAYVLEDVMKEQRKSKDDTIKGSFQKLSKIMDGNLQESVQEKEKDSQVANELDEGQSKIVTNPANFRLGQPGLQSSIRVNRLKGKASGTAIMGMLKKEATKLEKLRLNHEKEVEMDSEQLNKKYQREIMMENLEQINEDDLSDKDDASQLYIDNFALQDDDEIESLQADVSDKALHYDNLFVKARVESQNKSKKQRRKLKTGGLFNSGFGFVKKGFSSIFADDTTQYIDFDTDEEEEMEDLPEYLKGREEFQDDLEDNLLNEEGKGVIQTVCLKRGNQRDPSEDRAPPPEEVANFKFLFVREDKKDIIPITKIKKFLQDMLKSRVFTLRVYILKGIGITPSDGSEDAETFVRLSLNGEVQESEPKPGLYPEYYEMFEFQNLNIPGSVYLNIEILDKSLFGSSLIGNTIIDLEKRIFSCKWQNLEKKPIEKRNIVALGKGSKGRIELWVELLNPIKLPQPVDIYPKQQNNYELRVVVWEAKDCVFKDELEGANDLYVRGGVKGQDFKMTDTHWRCRATGSFNWRLKYNLQLPVDQNKNYGSDSFVIQLWDRDLIAADDLIGEAEIDLNIHKMLKKAHARKNQSVTMRRRIKGSGVETKKLWFDVFHPDAKDEYDNKISQGKVCLSFEVLPECEIGKYDNAEGRKDPNFFPTLPDPVGRFSLDIFDPLGMLKIILGPALYYKLWTCFWCILLFYCFGMIINALFTQMIASLIGATASTTITRLQSEVPTLLEAGATSTLHLGIPTHLWTQQHILGVLVRELQGVQRRRLRLTSGFVGVVCLPSQITHSRINRVLYSQLQIRQYIFSRLILLLYY